MTHDEQICTKLCFMVLFPIWLQVVLPLSSESRAQNERSSARQTRL